MGFVLIKCKLCGEDVEIDESDPKKLLLNPKRDKIRHPRALHICSGKPKKYIQQIMQETAEQYNAKFTLFDQSFIKWKDNPTGVCFALCKVWIQSLDKISTHKFTDHCEENLSKIEKKQSSYIRKLKVGSSRVDSRKLSIETEMVKSKWIYKTNENPDFWKDAVQDMCSLTMRKNLVSLSFEGGRAGHAVATCEHADKNYFFDPNGGIMAFETALDLEDWLREEFPKATSDRYDKVCLVEVYDYDPLR
jgi:Yersinia/Haemophilus virulence surface antigen